MYFVAAGVAVDLDDCADATVFSGSVRADVHYARCPFFVVEALPLVCILLVFFVAFRPTLTIPPTHGIMRSSSSRCVGKS